MRGRVRAMRVSGEYEYGSRTMIETKDHVFDSRAKCDRKGSIVSTRVSTKYER